MRDSRAFVSAYQMVRRGIYFRKYSDIPVRQCLIHFLEALTLVAQWLLKRQYQPPNSQLIFSRHLWLHINCKRVSKILQYLKNATFSYYTIEKNGSG